MSKEIAEEKIKTASAVLALAKSLHIQLIELENSKFDEMRGFYDFLVLLQTSIYSTLVLNLYHLLKDGEKHSISKQINLAVEFLGLDKELAGKMKAELAANEKAIEALQENRDKRIAHFDKKHIAPLDDKTIGQLLEVAEKLLKELNLKALKRDHSFNIPFSKGLGQGLEIWQAEFAKVVQK